MKDRNWKKALLRFYYIAWVLYTLLFLSVAVNGLLRDTADVFIWLAAMLLPPPALLWATRWVYAGLQDKDETPTQQSQTQYDNLRKIR